MYQTRSARWKRGKRSLATLSTAALLGVGFAVPAYAAGEVFISEIHYDNAGTDTGEAIEVQAPEGTDLTGWQVVLYNGSGAGSTTPRLCRPRWERKASRCWTTPPTGCRTASRMASPWWMRPEKWSSSSPMRASSRPPMVRRKG